MINAKVMYLRPGNLYKKFIIEENRQTLSEDGRMINNYVGDGTRFLHGCLAAASPETSAKCNQLGHQVSHTIVQRGTAKAKPGDMLILGDRHFVIERLDDAGGLRIAVIYYVREMV